jgi:hypothetical protein
MLRNVLLTQRTAGKPKSVHWGPLVAPDEFESTLDLAWMADADPLTWADILGHVKGWAEGEAVTVMVLDWARMGSLWQALKVRVDLTPVDAPQVGGHPGLWRPSRMTGRNVLGPGHSPIQMVPDASALQRGALDTRPSSAGTRLRQHLQLRALLKTAKEVAAVRVVGQEVWVGGHTEAGQAGYDWWLQDWLQLC